MRQAVACSVDETMKSVVFPCKKHTVDEEFPEGGKHREVIREKGAIEEE